MSKRIIKNVIMVLLIISFAVAMFFTVKPQNSQFNPGNKEMFENMQDFGTMPEGFDFSNGEFPENMPEGQRPSMPEDFNPEEGMPKNSEKKSKSEMSEDGTRSQMPEGMDFSNKEFSKELPEGVDFSNVPEGMIRDENRGNFFGRMSIRRIILCVVEALGISLLSIYLVLSKFNKLTLKETFENKSKIVIYIILVVLITTALMAIVLLVNKNSRRNFEGGNRNGMMMPFDEEVEKTTKAEDVDSGTNVNTETINLNEHTSNITITEPGNYTLTGEFGYTVLVNATGEVVLNLNNAKIENKLTAALANISTQPLTINLMDGTSNVFSDGGSSEYDACVYSAGPLTFKGNGSLEVYGNQEEGEGIATETNNLTIDGGNIKIISNDDGLNAGGDGGTIKINNGTVYIKANGDGIDSNKNIVINGGSVYTIGSSKGGDAGIDADDGTTINGGELIALGSDMLEKPLKTSKQKTIVKNLDKTIEAGSNVILKDTSGNEIISFIADDSFKTIIISNSKLTEGKYNLYKGEELITELECK